jgi:hypothetical protein
MIATEINEFFKYLNELLDKFVTGIEVKPIRIKKDMYITGFRKYGIAQFEAHVKHIKQFLVKTDDYTMEMPLKSTPEAEMWIDVELLSQQTVREAFNDLRNYFYTLKGFVIAELSFRLKNETDNYSLHDETIIYDAKGTAAKETIAKRKFCSVFKSSFTNWGKLNGIENKEKQPTISDEEFADMAL